MTMMPNPGRIPSSSNLGPLAPVDQPPADGEDRLRLWDAPSSTVAPASASEASLGALEAILEEFTLRWDRGESPRAEQYLDRLPPGDPEAPVELIYHEFCLLAAAGQRPSPEQFAGRFPQHRDRLFRLIALQEVLPPVEDEDEGGASGPRPGQIPLEPGDEIGPYRLLRELGRGGFARVFLAADTELEDRLLVIKVSRRPSAEHRYLARAPHPHIVPILRERTTPDGLQLIFMPFVGGATLGDLLQQGRRRAQRPERGLDLLDDLDRCSAPEYTAAGPARPAREILATLGHAQAICWVVARLAEALDHAYRRGITHGDLKPSNVLIGGDGQPMLLDFNLSLDGGPSGASTASGDPGGTLAYMAPERLLALAEPERASPPDPAARHQADLYALGLILMEALTGSAPEMPPADGTRRPLSTLAARLAWDRTAGGGLLVGHQLASIPPGLRAILRRCLAPEPEARYALCSQLAADLDRWRAGLSLAHAHPPAWIEAARWARYHRRPILAAGLCLALGLVAMVATDRMKGHSDTLQNEIAHHRRQAHSRDQEKLDALWNDPESGAYGYWDYRPGQMSVRHARLDFAERALNSYGLADDYDTAPWDDETQLNLDELNRADLRIWLLEQALLLGIDATRPHYDPFPEDRQAALAILERLLRDTPAEPLQTTARRLRAQLGLPPAAALPAAPSSEAVPGWVESYLQGIRAEFVHLQDVKAMGLDVGTVGYSAAIRHYRAALGDAPDLYWPRYRLAAASLSIGHFDVASAAYEACLERRPNSAVLWLGRGSTQHYTGAAEQAIQSYRKALAHSPRWDAPWRNLAMIGTMLDQGHLVEEALGRIRLQHRSGRNARLHLLDQDLSLLRTPLTGGRRPFALAAAEPSQDAPIDATGRPDDRYNLGLQLQLGGKVSEASRHYSRVLDENPAFLHARFNRAICLQRLDRWDEAIDEYQIIAEDPNLPDFIRDVPTGVMSLILISSRQATQGHLESALQLAREACTYAQDNGQYRGEASYALARAYAIGADINPIMIQEAARALRSALRFHPGYVEAVFSGDPVFQTHRAEYLALVGELGS